MHSFVLIVAIVSKYRIFEKKAASECRVSIQRIQSFLEIPELPLTIKDVAKESTDDLAFSFKDFTCMWDFNYQTSTSVDKIEDYDVGVIALQNVNVDFHMNELTFIIGTVGGGKSAFLYAAAGELVAHKGSITRNNKSIAFAPQDPWIMNGSIRENILMGLPFDDIFYEKVVKSCGLDVDFEQFVGGDGTLVGDRGVQCSGGQVCFLLSFHQFCSIYRLPNKII